MSVRTVASAASIPARLMAICPLAEKRFWSTSPSCFLSSSSWSLNLCTRPPNPLSLASPLMYSVGPSGALAAVVTNLMKPFIWSMSTGTKMPTTRSSATNTPRYVSPMARGRLMILCRRWSQFTAGLSTAARKRAMTNQPMKVRTCHIRKSAPSTTAVVSKATATVRITCEVEARAHPPSWLGRDAFGSVGVLSSFG